MGDINEEMQELLYSNLVTWNVQLDTMHLLVLLGINYFQLYRRQQGLRRALVLKSVTGYVMGLHLTEGSFLLMVWKKRKEEDNTGL